MSTILLILIGFLGGIFSGFFGVGGGSIMIPLLVFLLGLSQHQAQGTILAVLLLPVGALGVWKYFQSGNVQLGAAALIALGFVGGIFLGAQGVNYVSDANLQKAFGIFLVLVGLKMIF